MNNHIIIPRGRFAADDAALAAKRAALKAKLLSGDKISLKPGTGNAVQGGGSDSSISIPKGKLAAQWYETNPTLLQAEKDAMAECFPGFELGKLDDGRLYWMGELVPGIYEAKFGRKKSYYVMAVYQNNHPQQVMGSSVHVYPVNPDEVDLIRLIRLLGARLNFLRDSAGGLYFYPLKEDLSKLSESAKKENDISRSAVIALRMAFNWLVKYESILIDSDKIIQIQPYRSI